MSRKTVMTAGSIVAAAASFALTAAAFGGSSLPRLRGDLPAVALASRTLPAPVAVQINDSLRGDSAATYGVSAASYAAARLVASTDLGPMYLIPGTSGACLYLAGSLSCGDPGQGTEHFLALAMTDPSTGNWVGGGITDGTVTAVKATDPVGTSARTLNVRAGVFAIGNSDSLKTQHLIFAMGGNS